MTALQSTTYSELSERWGVETSAAYAEANLEGLEMIRHRVHDEHIDCDLRIAPALTYSESGDGVAKVEAEVEAARRAGLDVSFTTESDLPFEIAGAARLEDQAQFHPRKYCQGLVRGILAEGGAVFEETRASGSRCHGGGGGHRSGDRFRRGDRLLRLTSHLSIPVRISPV